MPRHHPRPQELGTSGLVLSSLPWEKILFLVLLGVFDSLALGGSCLASCFLRLGLLFWSLLFFLRLGLGALFDGLLLFLVAFAERFLGLLLLFRLRHWLFLRFNRFPFTSHQLYKSTIAYRMISIHILESFCSHIRRPAGLIAPYWTS